MLLLTFPAASMKQEILCARLPLRGKKLLFFFFFTQRQLFSSLQTWLKAAALPLLKRRLPFKLSGADGSGQLGEIPQVSIFPLAVSRLIKHARPGDQTNNAAHVPIRTSSNPHNPAWGLSFSPPPTLSVEEIA